MMQGGVECVCAHTDVPPAHPRGHELDLCVTQNNPKLHLHLSSFSSALQSHNCRKECFLLNFSQ